MLCQVYPLHLILHAGKNGCYSGYFSLDATGWRHRVAQTGSGNSTSNMVSFGTRSLELWLLVPGSIGRVAPSDQVSTGPYAELHRIEP